MASFHLVTCSLLMSMCPFASRAILITETAQYADGSVPLSGFIASPSGAGPFPVVIHVHAIGGLSDFERARANRTAAELGYIGFAVSVYDEADAKTAASGGWGPQVMALSQKYTAAPQLVVSRLAAAVDFIKKRANVDPQRIAAVGYCFGGTAVLNFARLGGTSAAGVSGVVSFHGGLSGMGMLANATSWNNTRVLILNGAADFLIPKKDIDPVRASMTAANITWEFTNYGHAHHGFTHPKDGDDHFHYDSVAQERSWSSMSDFLGNSLGFKVTAPAAPQLHTEEVTYMDGNVTLKGHIAYRANAVGPLPVVLHVHAWGGLSDFEKARANRTAAELGYIGFAVSVYDGQESAKAANPYGFQDRISISTKYGNSPELIVSRLHAATAFVKKHSKADASKIAAVGYCFGGAAVLQYARLGGAQSAGVGSVASFHGSLGGIVNKESNFCPTRVAVYNGAKDDMISDAELVALQKALETTNTYWELTNYSFAGHGFTHPTEASNDHFHFEKTAESRSWISMAHFLQDSFMGKGKANSSTCAKFVPPTAQGGCQDDNAAVAKAGGSWGVTKCAANLCEGQYKDMMGPLCKKTCGLCSEPCQDDNAAVAKAGGSWGVTKCAANLCQGQYKDMMGPLCKKTCGLCSEPCQDDNAAVAKAGGAWGVTKCAANLCDGQYKDMMRPLCKSTCGLCTQSNGQTNATTTTTTTSTMGATTTTTGAMTTTTTTVAATTTTTTTGSGASAQNKVLKAKVVLTVDNPLDFANSPHAKTIMKKSIANASTDLTTDMITIDSVTASVSGRLLSESDRRLAGTVDCRYTVTYPPTHSGSTFTAASIDVAKLKTAIKGEAAKLGVNVSVASAVVDEPQVSGATTTVASENTASVSISMASPTVVSALFAAFAVLANCMYLGRP